CGRASRAASRFAFASRTRGSLCRASSKTASRSAAAATPGRASVRSATAITRIGNILFDQTLIFELVRRDGRVDVSGPPENPARQNGDQGKAVALQVVRYLQASSADPAHHHDLPSGIELPKSCRNLAHGDVNGARQAGE